MGRTSIMPNIQPRLVVNVEIVGQSSPRWQGANSEANRVENNRRLSEARADAVKNVVEKTLRKALVGRDLTFQYDVSYPDDTHIPDHTVVIGSSGRGQSDSIVAARGDKRNNDQKYRRVDVTIRIAQELQQNVPRRVESTMQHSAKTRNWFISVAAGVTVADVAAGSLLFVQLRNEYGQTASGQAIVGGVGFGATVIPGFDKGAKAGASFGDEAAFTTTDPVTFDAFDGAGLNYTSASAALYFGYEVDRLGFFNLGPGAMNISVGGPSVGAQLGASVMSGNGVLWLNNLPPNYVIKTYSHAAFDRIKLPWLGEHKVALFFATGSFDLLVDDRVNLGDALDQTVKDIVGG
jgi:hypothetical protein